MEPELTERNNFTGSEDHARLWRFVDEPHGQVGIDLLVVAAAAVDVVKVVCLVGICVCVVWCGLITVHEVFFTPRPTQPVSRPSNVVRLVPRTRPYDWQQSEDAS